MAEVKITALPAYSDPVSTDVLPIVDVTADLTKKVSITDLLKNAATGSETAPAFAFDADPDTGMYRRLADELAFSTGGTGRLCINSSGNVGIGQLNPSEILHLRNSSDPTIRIDNIGATAKQGRVTVTTAGDMEFRARNNASDGQFIFYGYGAITDNEYARFDSGGRLLIGTSTSHVVGSNQQALQVRGTATNNSRIQILRESSDNGGGGIHIAKARGTSFQALNDEDQIGIIAFNAADGTDLTHQAANIQCLADGASSSNSVPGKLVLRTTGDSGTTPVTRMAITREGYVLIGGQQESDISGGIANTKLQVLSSTGGFVALGRDDASVVAGNAIGGLRFYANDPSGYNEVSRIVCDADGPHGTDDYPTRLEFYTTADNENEPTERLRIDSSGNVGIGTESPTGYIHIEGTSTGTETYGRFTTGPAAGDQSLVIKSGSSRDHMAIQVKTNADNVDDLSLQPDGGNVGIGTISPSGSLHVDAASGVDGPIFDSGGAGNTNHALLVRDSSNSQLLRVNNNGNVGIGTTSPGRTLDVNGVIRSDGTSGALAFGGNSSTPSEGAAIHRPANNTLALCTNSTERMRIDSSGNVGIGETSVGAGLDVKRDVNPVLAIDRGTANTANFNLQYNGTLTGQLGAASNLFQISAAGASTPMAFYANGAERMRIDSSGNVGIGTTSPNDKLEIKGANGGYSFRVDAETSPVTIRSEDNTGGAFGALRFTAGNASTEAERMRIDSSGRMLVGLTADTGSQSDRRETLQLGHNNGPRLILARSSTTAGDTNTIGIVHFRSNGGDSYHDSAQILVSADGAHSATDKAADMIFKVTKNNETATTEAFRINSNTRIDLPSGSPGITFDGNTGDPLKAYEEGTFTVEFADATTGGNQASTSNKVGRYTRIGNLVTVVVFGQNINTSGMTGTNDFIIRNLPFQAVNVGSTPFWTGSIMIDGGLDLEADEFNPYVTIGDNHSYARIMIPDNTGNRRNLDVQDITSGVTDFRFSITYEVAD